MQALMYRSKCWDAEYEQMYTDLARQGAIALMEMLPHHPAALEAQVQVLMLQEEMDYDDIDPMSAPPPPPPCVSAQAPLSMQ